MSGTVQRLGELPHVGPAALCMGVFDGVHLGHRALVDLTMRVARERGLASVALLFDPPPIEILRPEQRVPRLAPVGENLRRLGEAGVDAPVALHFDDATRQLTPEDFLAALAPAIELRALVMTPESAFGRARAGTPEAMREHGRSTGFEVVILDQLVLAGGEPVSSSRIRDLIREGSIPAARDLLAAAPYLAGSVDPAGTMRFAYPPALPGPGRYAGRARDGDRPVELAVRDGRVTVADASAGTLEIDLSEREGARARAKSGRLC